MEITTEIILALIGILGTGLNYWYTRTKVAAETRTIEHPHRHKLLSQGILLVLKHHGVMDAARNSDIHTPAFWRVFDGIADEVDQNLGQTVAIPYNLDPVRHFQLHFPSRITVPPLAK